jgi:hypothetical protein
MKLIKDEKSAWETYLVEGYPFGIEKIDRGAWFPFQLWGGRRIYLDTKGTGKERAKAFLEEEIREYESRIIVGVTA